MEYLRQALALLNSVPAEAWNVVTQTVLSALTVSPLFLGIKKWWQSRGKEIGEKLMMTWVILGSVAAAWGWYLKDDPRFAPWVILVQGMLTFAVTQPVYYLFVKPLFTRLGIWFADRIAAATALNEAKAAIVPPEGLPIAAAAEDFSR